MAKASFIAACAASVLFAAPMALAQAPAPAPAAPAPAAPATPPPPMTFFVTSVGLGKGADLGGLAGADAHCKALATAAGSPATRTWRAYLSTQAAGGQPAVNARDRIGNGPWHNARGARIAQDVAWLHGDTLDQARFGNNLSRTTALSEKNEPIKGAGDQPNQHDILTGSNLDGRAFLTEAGDRTCGNWTSSADGQGAAMVGHHDRTGGGNTSWVAAHPSRGCSQQNLIATGGNGYFYCFAID